MIKHIKDIRIKAMDLLARREHSAVELVEKLRLRFPEQAEACEEAVVTLCNEGLQSDQRFAESFIRMRAARGHGPLKIAAELRQKGVAAELITHSLQESEFDWFELAQQSVVKRFGERPAENLQEKARRMRFLAQRGFSLEQIREAVG